MRLQFCLCAAALGCQSESGIETVDGNDLGVAGVTIERDSDGDDHTMIVRGVDANGDEVARATLRTGLVEYSAEPELIAPGWTLGRRLDVTVGDESYPLVNPALVPMTVPAPVFMPKVTSFLRLKVVADALATEGSIHFASRLDGGELPFSAQNCDGSQFAASSGNPSQCCYNNDVVYGQMLNKIPNGANAGRIAQRLAGTGRCQTASFTTGCTSDCFYGPCGWGQQAIWGTSSSWVFHPTSYPNECGADGNDGTIWNPPSNTNYYAGLTATCPFTACNSDGTASGPLTVNVVGAPGAVHDASWSLYAQTGSPSSQALTPTITLTAVSLGGQYAHVQSWTGPCAGSGDTCTLYDWTPGPWNITVTFYCESGQTCDWQ